MKTPAVEIATEEFDARLEAIAKDIESTQAKAILHVAERLTEARELFRYRRDEGGFGGWVENRLHLSRQTAYNLLNVHKQFGGQSVKTLDTFAPSILYLLAAPSTPESARHEIMERDEPVTVAEVKQTITTAKGRKARGGRPNNKTSVSEPEPEQIDLEDAIGADAETSAASRKAAYAADEPPPEPDQQLDGECAESNFSQTDEQREPPFDEAMMKAIDTYMAALRGRTDLQILQIREYVNDRVAEMWADDGTIKAHWAAEKKENRQRAGRKGAETRARRQREHEAADGSGAGEDFPELPDFLKRAS